MKIILRFVFSFVIFFLYTSTVSAITYTGNYTSGLTVSENGAIVENSDITNTGGGVCLIITGDNVTVRNTRIHNCQDHGVMFKGTNGGIIENSEIYRAAMRNPPNSVSSGWPSLMKVQSIDETAAGLAQNITIRNNYIHEGYGECMGLRGTHINVIGNHVKDCFSIGIYSNSDHTYVESNNVECTGNAEFNRAGLPMVGIGFAEESFANWGAHGHDTQTVLRNTVTGCKYGVRYGASTNNMGLANTEIAYNRLLNIRLDPISITHYPSETNVNIHDNIIGTGPVPTPSVTPRPTNTSPPTPTHTPTAGSLIADVNRDNRIDIIDIGIIIDNYGRHPIPNLRADVNGSGDVDIIDIGIVIDNYGR
jgi:hypothetical protein